MVVDCLVEPPENRSSPPLMICTSLPANKVIQYVTNVYPNEEGDIYTSINFLSKDSSAQKIMQKHRI